MEKKEIREGYDVIRLLEEAFPLKEQMEWDNSGLMAGDRSRRFHKVYLALDATMEVIDAAIGSGADLLLTHHPLLFRGIKSVTSDSLEGRKLLKLLSNHIACFSMHTNYDALAMGTVCASKLGITDGEGNEARALEITGEDPLVGIGKIGYLPEPMTLKVLAEKVKEAFGIDRIHMFGDPDRIVSRIAMVPGSGKSDISTAIRQNAEVFLTGDIGHHDGLDALELGLSVLDAGHYGLEHVFVENMEANLKKWCPELEIVKAPTAFPFLTV